MGNFQNLIHQLEEGKGASIVKIVMLVVLSLVIAIAFIFDPLYRGYFKGMNNPKGMEQAAIAKHLAEGKGFSTPVIRPLAVKQLKENEKPLPENFPDTYNVPVWPMVLTPVVKVMKDHWSLADKWMQVVYPLDRAVAGVSILFFYLGGLISFFAIRRVFDAKIAGLALAVTFLSAGYWNYVPSGLPQLFVFFLSSIALYTFVRAVEARINEASPLPWLAATAALFGLMALTHQLTIWVFAGALLFSLIYFKNRGKVAATMIAIFLAFYTPWLIRNYQVSGNLFGISHYSVLNGFGPHEAIVMGGEDVKKLEFNPLNLRGKIQNNLSKALGNIYSDLGGVIVAPIFFLTLLHLFRRPQVAHLRWALLSMWFFAQLGMAIYPSDDMGSSIASDNLNLIFIPFFSAYGFVFVLMLWNRLEIGEAILRKAFIGALIAVSAFPFLNILTAGSAGAIQWPPYFPPTLGAVEKWTKPNEVVASDMPWAVGWYGNRDSFLMPVSAQRFVRMVDFDELDRPIVGVLITPISGNRGIWSDYGFGEYQEWLPLLTRQGAIRGFPFSRMVPLPIGNQNILFTDEIRAARMKKDADEAEKEMKAEEEKKS